MPQQGMPWEDFKTEVSTAGNPSVPGGTLQDKIAFLKQQNPTLEGQFKKQGKDVNSYLANIIQKTSFELPDAKTQQTSAAGSTPPWIAHQIETASLPQAGAPVTNLPPEQDYGYRKGLMDMIVGGLQGLGTSPQEVKHIGPGGLAVKAGVGIANLAKEHLMGRGAQTIPPILSGIAAGPKEMQSGITNQNPSEKAVGFGQTFTGTVLPLAAPIEEGVNDTLGTAIEQGGFNSAREAATTHVINALRPRTREMKAVAQGIGPDLAARGVGGFTADAVDNNIFDMLDRDTKALHEAEDSIRPGTKLRGFGDYVLPQIDRTIDALLKRKANGGALAPHDATIAALRTLREQAAKLGNNPEFADVVDFRRNLDDTIKSTGGFKQSTDTADYVNKVAARSVANVTRDAINGAAPKLAEANHNFHVSRAAADIVEDRQLGQVGRIDAPSGLDLILGLGGYATEGIPGAAAITGFRRLTQSRGVQATLARANQHFASPPEAPVETLPKDWNAITDDFNRSKLRLSDPNAGQVGSQPTAGRGTSTAILKGNIPSFRRATLPPPPSGVTSVEDLAEQQRRMRGNLSGSEAVTVGKRPLPMPPSSIDNSGVTGTPAPTGAPANQPVSGPSLESFKDGIDEDRMKIYGDSRLREMHQDASKIASDQGFDPLQRFDKAYTPGMRKQLMNTAEGQRNIQGLFNAWKRLDAADATTYASKIMNQIRRIQEKP